MRTQFNYYVVLPEGVSPVYPKLPVFPSRATIEETSSSNIMIKKNPQKRDWLKLSVIGLGMMTLMSVSALGYQQFRTNKQNQDVHSAGIQHSETTSVKAPTKTITQSSTTETVVATASAAATNTSVPIQHSTAPVLPAVSQNQIQPASVSLTVESSPVVEKKGNVAPIVAKTNTSVLPVNATIKPSTPAPNTIKPKTIDTRTVTPVNAGSKQVTSPASVAVNSPGLTQPVPPANLPNLVTANANLTVSRPVQSGIFKRAQPEAKSQENAKPPSVDKHEVNSQKLF
ncbi:hypothetical protein [Undibacterium oligocarboniphilum]|uniref:Uncharacterized protein n=1 Tax=Undibacterium oligocarboniphilum TaxID=666702 RepID=A0A850QSH9_9BURK|nr:hypothetical protein [Undibacterium oligocarboniphilum]MBC3871428.1 hypothetical protein [Undibacterium oligocarboniphilum]NVO78996.1 hypothetical protein [Undibacterium oligocarboniphilum]